jgi:hypothetical protein
MLDEGADICLHAVVSDKKDPIHGGVIRAGVSDECVAADRLLDG